MGPVALVTGGGGGIGRVIALALARAGHVVVVNDVSDTGREVAAEVERLGQPALFFAADVTDSAAVRDLFAAIDARFGRLDVLVNSAGRPGAFALLLDRDDATWQRTVAVHLHGTFYCLREAARRMVGAGGGRIVNIASIAGLVGTVGSGEYAAAKAAVIGLTRTAAKELGPFHVTVNAIAPGMTATAVNAGLAATGSPFIGRALEGTPTGRMAEPDEVAALVVHLCSAAARNVNGAVIPLDGGATLAAPIDGFMHAYLSKRSPFLRRASGAPGG